MAWGKSRCCFRFPVTYLFSASLFSFLQFWLLPQHLFRLFSKFLFYGYQKLTAVKNSKPAWNSACYLHQGSIYCYWIYLCGCTGKDHKFSQVEIFSSFNFGSFQFHEIKDCFRSPYVISVFLLNYSTCKVWLTTRNLKLTIRHSDLHGLIEVHFRCIHAVAF